MLAPQHQRVHGGLQRGCGGRAGPSARVRRGCNLGGCGAAGLGLRPPPGCLHADGFLLLPGTSYLVESVVGHRWSMHFFCMSAPGSRAGPPKPCAGGTLEPPTPPESGAGRRCGQKAGASQGFSRCCSWENMREACFPAWLGPGTVYTSPNPIL